MKNVFSFLSEPATTLDWVSMRIAIEREKRESHMNVTGQELCGFHDRTKLSIKSNSRNTSRMDLHLDEAV
jgi:hypothetical protein